MFRDFLSGLITIKDVGPWIQRDIEQAKECKADAMLQALLQRASCAPETKQSKLLQKPECLKAVLSGHLLFWRRDSPERIDHEQMKIYGMRAPVPTVDRRKQAHTDTHATVEAQNLPWKKFLACS
ncbi:uncharacterized protein EDB93DRAFT_1103685 [Suillus bovinus]|uniref:uncharacterized protein n=1 Tax=Suillus bovinus TaxID=48563 RepID=UPI001B8792B7|nr:uncharacterized protein EDB93DRAFT_1103685 [Suillus bovinus]KAG2149129.1 hypothetical protein EDB93DRAFT_1103685 [Suillus bovinus]